MLNNFNKILGLKRHIPFEHVTSHIYFKEREMSTIDDIINYAHNKPDGEKHIEFLQEYKSQIEEHISLIKQTVTESETLSNDLTNFLNEADKEAYIKKDNVRTGGHSFYISYYRGEFIFITQMNDDSHLKMDMYLIFTYLYNGKKLKLHNSSVGYTDKTLDDLRNHPSLLVQEIEKIDTLTNVEDVNNQYSKCQDLFKQLFNLSEVDDILLFNDSYYTDLFGNPAKLWIVMENKRVTNVIKLQLKQNNVNNVTPDLIALIETENEYKQHILDEEFQDKKYFDKQIERLINKKNSLMTSLQIDQDLLDHYMSFINLKNKG